MTPETATAYWSKFPDSGIAIICGRPSNLIVVDVDPRNGGNKEEAARDCPSLLQVTTGGDGLHLYCTPPEGSGLIPCGHTEKTGVDRKGDGGYVVAPPSIHPDTGKAYEWTMGGASCVVPEWVLRSPAPGPGTTGEGGGAQWIAHTIKNLDQCTPGSQHETLTKLAWWLSALMDEDIAQVTLYLWPIAMPLSRPEEPWRREGKTGTDELLRSAYAKRLALGQTPGFTTYLVAGEPVANVDVEKRVFDNIVCAKDWEMETNNEWIIENLIAPACFTEVIGEVKKGKTTLTSQLIHCMLNGIDFLGMKVKQTPVVLCTEQAGLSLERTLSRADVRKHPDLHFITYGRLFGLPWKDAVAALLKYCDKVGAKVIFIDTLSRISGMEGDLENSSGGVAVLNAFQVAKMKGIACVFVRHASKSLENRNDISRAGRGSTAITGEMDICIHLAQPGAEDIRVLRMVSRLGEMDELVLRYKNGIYEIVPEGEVKTGQQRVKDANTEKVKKAVADGAKTTAEIVRITGMAKETVRKKLKELRGGMEITIPDGDETPEEK